jgi:hypothetical protein
MIFSFYFHFLFCDTISRFFLFSFFLSLLCHCLINHLVTIISTILFVFPFHHSSSISVFFIIFYVSKVFFFCLFKEHFDDLKNEQKGKRRRSVEKSNEFVS